MGIRETSVAILASIFQEGRQEGRRRKSYSNYILYIFQQNSLPGFATGEKYRIWTDFISILFFRERRKTLFTPECFCRAPSSAMWLTSAWKPTLASGGICEPDTSSLPHTGFQLPRQCQSSAREQLASLLTVRGKNVAVFHFLLTLCIYSGIFRHFRWQRPLKSEMHSFIIKVKRLKMYSWGAGNHSSYFAVESSVL